MPDATNISVPAKRTTMTKPRIKPLSREHRTAHLAGLEARRDPRRKLTPELVDEIIDWITVGRSLRSFCQQEGRPTWGTVYGWLRDDPQFAARFKVARDAGADAMAEYALEQLRQPPERIETTDSHGKVTGTRIDPAFVQWQKVIFDATVRLLSTWSSGRYSDRVQVDGAEGAQGVRLVVFTGVRVDAEGLQLPAAPIRLLDREPEAESIFQ